ncbi:MBL fold metallo-hydrolase [Desulfatiferula olefinivorans]
MNQDITPVVSVCVLASGSKGNAIYLESCGTAILIDAGLSGKEIEKRLALRGLRPDALSAIVISHEHTDHIKGAGIFSRRHKLPLYINEKTFEAGKAMLGDPHRVEFIDCGKPFRIGSMAIHPFSISHDAADPSGFTVDCRGTRIGVATDLGIANLVVREHLKQAHLLILESNHDPSMLFDNERYPWPLKQRVRGRKGHLANEEARELLADLIHDRLHHVILAHLSEENNTRDKARHAAVQALNGSAIGLSIAGQHEPGEVFRISAQGMHHDSDDPHVTPRSA